MLNNTTNTAAAASLAIEEALTPCDAPMIPVWESCTRQWDVCDCAECASYREAEAAQEAAWDAQSAAWDEWARNVRIAAVYCACCSEPLAWDKDAQRVAQDVAINDVYKCGELSYTELAHPECAPEWEVHPPCGYGIR